MAMNEHDREESSWLQPGPDRLVVVPYGRRRRRVGELIALVLALAIFLTVIRRPAFEWHVVADYLFDRQVLLGVRTTIILTLLSLVIGFSLSVPLAVARLSANRVLRWLAFVYVWLFRGTPVLVQLLIWYNLSLLFPHLILGIPFTNIHMYSEKTNDLMTPFVAATVGLSLNLAAYMAEVVRGGIIGVEQGQVLSARALGMPSGRILRRIVLPQAMRTIVPTAGNYSIGMLKDTSLASVVALTELLLAVEIIYARTFRVIPLLVVASLWYLFLTTIFSIGQHFLEQRLSRGYGSAPTHKVRDRKSRYSLRRGDAVSGEVSGVHD